MHPDTHISETHRALARDTASVYPLSDGGPTTDAPWELAADAEARVRALGYPDGAAAEFVQLACVVIADAAEGEPWDAACDRYVGLDVGAYQTARFEWMTAAAERGDLRADISHAEKDAIWQADTRRVFGAVRAAMMQATGREG